MVSIKREMIYVMKMKKVYTLWFKVGKETKLGNKMFWLKGKLKNMFSNFENWYLFK